MRGIEHILPTNLAGAEAATGNDIEAKSALEQARRLNPQFTIKSLQSKLGQEHTTTWHVVADGLRKAGLPEE
jgi:hypothetical protein